QPLAEINSSAFPVLRMHEVDASVLVGAAGSLAPIDILKPFDSRAADVEVSAHQRNCAIETGGTMIAEKFAEVAIDFAAMSDGRNNHSHRWKTSGVSRCECCDHIERVHLQSNQVRKMQVYTDV